jgi:predicted RNA-binding Zn ribbon-like protein
MSTHPDPDPGFSPKPAPGDLDHIRKFVNTIDLESMEEDIGDPAALAAWLTERGLLAESERLTDRDVRRAHDVREAIRKLLLANNGEPLDAQAVETLNTAAAAAELTVRFGAEGGGTLAAVRPGFDGALARLMAIIFRAMADGHWVRLKACSAHDCEWAFYDWSKNRSGAWCDMRVCGNRAKARAYRERRQRGASAKKS